MPTHEWIIVNFGFWIMTFSHAFFHARYVGRLFVKSSTKPIEILEKLNKMAGFDPDQEIELFEVYS